MFTGYHPSRPVGLSEQMQSPAENGLEASADEEFEEDIPAYYKRASIKAENPSRLVFDDEKGNPDIPLKLNLYADESIVKELGNEDEDMRQFKFTKG